MKVKVLQSYPINCGNTHYQKSDEFDIDDKEASRLISEGRVAEVKSLKTNDNGGAPESAPLSPEERQEKIRAAVKELLAAKPDDKPKSPDIAAITGIKDVSAAERDAICAELKGN